MNEQPLVVRFQEYVEYDIQEDADVCTFMATTDRGSFFARVFVESPKSFRQARARFKDKAIDAMRERQEPCELILDEDDG
jgi:hypothetical protein